MGIQMNILKVVVTGPESTGKTRLASELALFFGTVWVPEYAREYISGLSHKYRYDDVESIAREQINQEKNLLPKANGILFYDTDLIVTKVWFKVVFGKYPEWIDSVIINSPADLYLVCDTDIPWVPDPVRENGGRMRDVLMGIYIDEIESAGSSWRKISGTGKVRTNNAIRVVKNFHK